jgi:hypothetical protein
MKSSFFNPLNGLPVTKHDTSVLPVPITFDDLHNSDAWNDLSVPVTFTGQPVFNPFQIAPDVTRKRKRTILPYAKTSCATPEYLAIRRERDASRRLYEKMYPDDPDVIKNVARKKANHARSNAKSKERRMALRAANVINL